MEFVELCVVREIGERDRVAESLAPRGSIAGTRYPVAHMSALDSEKR